MPKNHRHTSVRESGARVDPALILASQSPRRRALLARAGFRFRVIVPALDETPRPGERPGAFALRAACDKARAVSERLKASPRRRVVVGCDTIVALRGRIFGKPRTRADAARMLGALSGRTHEVLSGLAVLKETAPGRWKTTARLAVTRVRFRALSADEIARYVAGGEPMDKAGAYGIQEGAGHMVRDIRGSYTNVVGLPMAELFALLERAGIRPAAG